MIDDSSDQQLLDEVLGLLDRDLELTDDAKYLVYAAMEGEWELAEALGADEPAELPARVEARSATEPVGAYLKSISVSGFRGIGPRATLDLHPAAGLTVVVGRNGSGKSSFSEALELAITGSTYRWKDKSKVWSEHWRNLHDGGRCEVVVEVAEEGVGRTQIGATWSADAELADAHRWTQRPGQRREPGIDCLGWTKALGMYRPIVSYEELDDALDSTPSSLFDRIDSALGLGLLIRAHARLTAAAKDAESQEKRANDARLTLKQELADISDQRAVQALTTLRRHTPDVSTIQALAAGREAEVPTDLTDLRTLVDLRLPDTNLVIAVAADLNEAYEEWAAAGTALVERAELRTELLRQALDLHAHDGDGRCPVCGTGQLDAAWRRRVETELASEKAEISRRQATRAQLTAQQRTVAELVRSVPRPAAADHLDIASLPAAVQAWRRWNDLADDVGRETAASLPARFGALAESWVALRAEAGQLLADREDAWTPLATRLAEWVGLAQAAEKQRPTLRRAQVAAKFMQTVAMGLRQQRLASIDQQARQIWMLLRQDSDVDLGAIELKGQGNRRHVELHAAVDGAKAGALGVMSQGELHALALALFLPRATMSSSPFRFIVLDDPVQAMDPAKVDGLVQVLSDLSRHRQVIVLSHDDRLPQAIRQLGVDARIVEVTRELNSVVQVSTAADPADRYLSDARALARDDHLPIAVRGRVLPVLCRLAAEAAAQDRYFAQRLTSGESRIAVEAAWQAQATTAARLRLTLRGDPKADVSSWLTKPPYRRPAWQIVTKGAHGQVDGDPAQVVRDVERLVRDLRGGAV